MVVLRKQYILTPWFWISLLIVAGGVADIVLFFVMNKCKDNGQQHTIHIVASGLHFIRQLPALEVGDRKGLR